MVKKIIRFIIFAVTVFLQLPFINWGINALLPFFSPFVALLTIIASKKMDVEFLLALPLLILAMLKGRWFCWNICPLGSLLYLIKKISPFPKQNFLKAPDIKYFLLMAGVMVAMVGVPFFAVFDPLVIFNSFFAGLFLLIERKNALFLVIAMPLIAIILFNLFLPNIWCEKVCPLGCAQHLASMPLKYIFRKKIAVQDQEKQKTSILIPRRTFLYGVLGLVPLLPITTFFLKKGAAPKAVRPPGTLIDDHKLALTCIRCGSCMEICPQKIIIPDINNGFPSYGVPALSYNSHYCNEVCNRCTLVCPTNAISPLKIARKQKLKIGEARIDRGKCIAWDAGEACMVCHEFCPYQAIEGKKHRGVNCPVVLPEKCIGCGACESQCPARPQKAIIVHPVPQRFV